MQECPGAFTGKDSPDDQAETGNNTRYGGNIQSATPC